MVIESFKSEFVDAPVTERVGRYATILVVRRCDSECIFRTDNGEINNELTKAGITRDDLPNEFSRVFWSKRKGVAPERRTGRADLRKLDLLRKIEGENPVCEINNNMCGKCVDCKLYGSAIGSSISIKSRVVTDESFSILPYDEVTTEHTFNALYENGTMISDEGKHSQAINKDEVVRTGTHFLDMVTLTDVTMDEFLYVLANILRTKRYGAMTTRLGKVCNNIVGIVFSNTELFSNIEWVQATYDALCQALATPDGKVLDFPLNHEQVVATATQVIPQLAKTIKGKAKILPPQEVAELTQQVKQIYEDAAKMKDFLERIDRANAG